MNNERNQIRSPFKFLNPYGRGDKDIFFGRSELVEELYQDVLKNRLVLLYGQSGTGKTSLVQCGLANRFEVTDWAPFFIRRGKNINDSLNAILGQSKALGGAVVEEGQLLPAIERISTRYLRPVYLIFDQFEELLILGERAEQEKFLDTLEQLLGSEQAQSCNLLFILREEYFAWLEAFERRIPTFCDRRLRVEPMRSGKIEEVIVQSCKHYNVSFENEQENARQIRKNLQEKEEKTTVHLPYLQVYLDMLWREDFARTYPQGWQGQGAAPLEFATHEIAEFGKIENVFDRFLAEQRDAIQEEMEATHPGTPKETVHQVLNAFATFEGTKRPVSYHRKNGWIYPAENAPEALRQLPPALLTDCLEALERSRLLRDDGDTYELAHDSLAAHIDQSRSSEERLLNEARSRLAAGYREFQRTGVYLNRGTLEDIGRYLEKLELEAHLGQFVEESYTAGERQQREEEARKQREQEAKTTQEKLALEQKARRRQKMLSYVIGAIAIIAAGLGYNAYQASEDAEENLQKFHEADAQNVRTTVEDLLYRANALDSAGYHDQYQLLLRDARNVLRAKESNPFLQADIHRLDSLLKATSLQ